jgi:hypothetical protein
MTDPATMIEAWDAWAKEFIYRDHPTNYTFATAGSHFAAFKAGWDAAKKVGLTGEEKNT